MYLSTVSELTLEQYLRARRQHCFNNHKQVCINCTGMLQVANTVLNQGYCSLPCAFKIVSPDVAYNAERARRKLLHMPLVAVRVGQPESGRSMTLLLEYFSRVDYTKMSLVINSMAKSTQGNSCSGIEKCTLQALLSMAQSDRERETLRYVVYKASGLTATRARRLYGFERMNSRALRVEESILQMKRIRETVDEMAQIQDKALLSSFGLHYADDSSDSDGNCSDSSVEDVTDGCALGIETGPAPSSNLSISLESMATLMKQSNYNWFEFQERIVAETGDYERHSVVFGELLSQLENLDFSEHEQSLICQSKEAFDMAEKDAYEERRVARAINNEIVTDSESDNPDDYVGLSDRLDEKTRILIEKKRKAIQRRAKRTLIKTLAAKRYLSRKVSKRVSRILHDCPNIGEQIETFVKDCSVGADSWRRTGILTFDGNTKLAQKVTYERIRSHLEKHYSRKFSYGSIVELCVARNKRRRSAARYRGVAQVTTRRARKGFTLRYNPDVHWSAALYKGLNDIQLKDGREICLINRDDASGFRLDTLTTCRQYATPAVKGEDIVTTRTDFVNKYTSVLQTTCYNFTSTGTTAELCAGVVKAQGLHEKNPAQHIADLVMLQEQPELRCAFYDADGQPKQVDCIRVDGASDEGPVHEEVQFWWTERHYEERKVATLLTSRSSGSSYLNRVELQNGCLSRAHANTFIPSTLAGSCTNPETGAIDQERVNKNMDLAITAYINRVDGCPCGDAKISLFKGANSQKWQEKRKKLLVFLKGSKKQKQALLQEDSDLYFHFENIWKIRNSHMIQGLPCQYIFFLYCCYREDCIHPICQAGKPASPARWYPGGPPLTHLPLPIPDESRPWGGESCKSCKSFCAGHFKPPTPCDVTTINAANLFKPPSVLLKELFHHSCESISDDFVQNSAKSVLLPASETRFWLEHLHTIVDNRRRGAAKAAATRKARSKKTTEAVSKPEDDHEGRYFCATCGKEYMEEAEQEETWIGCDLCDAWYHTNCEKLEAIPECNYICIKCCSS